jgi:hypothetical protein
MRLLQEHFSKTVLISAFALVGAGLGCGFNPGEAGSGLNSNGTGTGTGTGTGNGGSIDVTGGGGSNGNGGGGGDVTLGSGGTTVCGQVNNPVMPEPPDVLIIQDKSGSMANDDNDQSCNGGCGANSKWSELTVAMTNVITATQTSVNWGLKYFSDTSACSASAAPVVTIGTPNAGTAIVNSIMMTTPGRNTPTRDAVTYGAMYMATLTDTNPKFLLLATDGLPNCPSGCAGMSNPSSMCTMTDNPNEDAAAEAAVSMAASMGFPTFVVGIGNVSTAVSTLNQMAINGGEAQTGAGTSYFAATDEQALEAALMAIVGKVASCTIPLTNVPPGQSNVAVSVDNSSGTPTKVPEDPNNGWSYTNGNMDTIQLNGSYCDGVKSGTYTNVQFVYACAGGTICIDKLADGTCGDPTM